MRRGITFSRRSRLAAVLFFATTLQIEAAEPAAVHPFDESSRAGHAFLTHLCDDFGGRLTGSPANQGAMQRLVAELQSLGLKPEMRPFKMPGWERRVDTVTLVAPFTRVLRTAALSYTQPQAAFEAGVVSIGSGREEDYPAVAEGMIALLAPSSPLQTPELVRLALSRGVRAILYINREAGGQLLARTGSFMGEALPLPVFTLTQEEGFWLQRLLARGQTLRMKIQTTSFCREIDTANVAVRFEGRSSETVIVGAHFDSWDLGQGAMDNGLGVAQLYALAHGLRGKALARSVELIWFNGEEQGLWGSRRAAAELGKAEIVAMVNLDMVGVPISVNALGDESLVEVLERFQAGRTVKLPKGVENINWFGSDHTPYQLAGVRAVTFNAPIDRASVRYYHDFADTIDKLPEKVVVDSTAIIADTILSLVEDPEIHAFRRSPTKTEALFTRFGIEKRMRAVGLWPFR